MIIDLPSSIRQPCGCNCSCEGCFEFVGLGGSSSLNYDLSEYVLPEAGDTITIYDGASNYQIKIKDIKIDVPIGCISRCDSTATFCSQYIGAISYTNTSETLHSFDWLYITGSSDVSSSIYSIKIGLASYTSRYLIEWNPTTTSTALSSIDPNGTTELDSGGDVIKIKRNCYCYPDTEILDCNIAESDLVAENATVFGGTGQQANGCLSLKNVKVTPSIFLIYGGLREYPADEIFTVSQSVERTGLTQSPQCSDVFGSSLVFGTYNEESYIFYDIPEQRELDYNIDIDINFFFKFTYNDYDYASVSDTNYSDGTEFKGVLASEAGVTFFANGSIFGSDELYTFKDYQEKKGLRLYSSARTDWDDDNRYGGRHIGGSLWIKPVCSC